MPIVFIGIKIALYVLWCWYGMRLLTPMRSASWLKAFGFALARLVLGVVLGLLWAMLLPSLIPSSEYSRIGFVESWC